MPVAQHPLHRSVRAELPHTAPALGRDDQTLGRVWVAGIRNGRPMRHQAMHSTPGQATALTASAQRAMPQPGDLEAQCPQPRAVARHAEVPTMPSHHRAQLLALLRDGMMPAPSEFELDRLQLGPQAFGTREPQDHEVALPRLRAAVREPKEVEGLRFALSLRPRFSRAKRPNSISRVFSACSFNPNRPSRSYTARLKRSASSRNWNPATQSSAYRTAITSPRAWRPRHCCTHRSNA
jgi:hypothetical protein